MDTVHLFIHSSVDGSIYQWKGTGVPSIFLLITNNVTMNILAQGFYGHIFSFHVGIYQGAEMLGHILTLNFTF